MVSPSRPTSVARLAASVPSVAGYLARGALLTGSGLAGNVLKPIAVMDEKQVVILAGGLATRMRPRTLTTPKLLLPVAGRPFGAWLLERLAGAGYRQAVLCIAYLGEQIREVIGDGRAFGIDVVYADEGPNLLGTAGAIRRVAAMLAPQFLVTYGDSYLPFDYGAPLRLLAGSPDADGVMAVFKNEGRWDKSNTIVRIDEKGEPWVERYEKNSADARFDHIDYGATALRRDVILEVPEGTPWGLDRIQAELSTRKRLRAYLAHAKFFEIGSETGLLELDQELSARPPGPALPPKVKP
jgi:N-acetyl-alpha-D-muramate 1-phosphate uridylyltransferase